jgi:hypothetical protein
MQMGHDHDDLMQAAWVFDVEQQTTPRRVEAQADAMNRHGLLALRPAELEMNLGSRRHMSATGDDAFVVTKIGQSRMQQTV